MSGCQQAPNSGTGASALSSHAVCSDVRSNRGVGKKRKHAETDVKQSLKPVGCSVCKEGEARYKCPKCRSTYCSIACCCSHKIVCSLNLNAVGSDNAPASDASLPDSVSQTDNQRISQSKYLSPSELRELQLDSKRLYNTLSELRQKVTDDQIDEDLGPGWKISDEMISAMNSSSWLRNELADVGLQQLISKIVATSSHLLPNSRGSPHKQLTPMSLTTWREKVLSETKDKFPQFQTFVDKLLCLTNVYERRPLQNGSLTPFDEWLLQDHDKSCISAKEFELFLKPVPRKQRTDKNVAKMLPSVEDESDSSSDSSDE